MLDHVGISVQDIERSIGFYDEALAPLGISRIMTLHDADEKVTQAGYGSGGKPDFWIGARGPVQGYVHVALAAGSRQDVNAFHAAALAAGATDNGAPGLRPEYHPGYYGAFVRDPDGINVEAVHHMFAQPAS